MSIFQSFFVQLQVRRPGLAHHISADEILKSRLRWTPRFVSAAAGRSCRRKRRWTSVWRAEAQTERDNRSEETSEENIWESWFITVAEWRHEKCTMDSCRDLKWDQNFEFLSQKKDSKSHKQLKSSLIYVRLNISLSKCHRQNVELSFKLRKLNFCRVLQSVTLFIAITVTALCLADVNLFIYLGSSPSHLNTHIDAEGGSAGSVTSSNWPQKPESLVVAQTEKHKNTQQTVNER